MILHTKHNTTHSMTHLKVNIKETRFRLAATLITIVSNPAGVDNISTFQQADIISNESIEAQIGRAHV